MWRPETWLKKNNKYLQSPGLIPTPYGPPASLSQTIIEFKYQWECFLKNENISEDLDWQTKTIDFIHQVKAAFSWASQFIKLLSHKIQSTKPIFIPVYIIYILKNWFRWINRFSKISTNIQNPGIIISVTKFSGRSQP